MALQVVVDNDEKAFDRRKQGGRWLKELREAKGLTQKQLSDQLKLNYYTFIAQIENGHVKLPERLYIGYAAALNVSSDVFLAKCLKYYHDPQLYENVGFVARLAG